MGMHLSAARTAARNALGIAGESTAEVVTGLIAAPLPDGDDPHPAEGLPDGDPGGEVWGQSSRKLPGGVDVPVPDVPVPLEAPGPEERVPAAGPFDPLSVVPLVPAPAPSARAARVRGPPEGPIPLFISPGLPRLFGLLDPGFSRTGARPRLRQLPPRRSARRAAEARACLSDRDLLIAHRSVVRYGHRDNERRVQFPPRDECGTPGHHGQTQLQRAGANGNRRPNHF